MTTKATKAQVMREAAKVGAAVTVNWQDARKGTIDVVVDAPDGQVFACCGAHGVVGNNVGALGGYAIRPTSEVWGGLLEDLRDGFRPCEEGDDCDVCHPVD